MNRLLFLFTFLLGFVACRHETPDPPAGEKKIYFTGITSVDDVGQALGSADPSDWRTDDSWEAQEKSLFPSTALLACNLSDSVQVYQFPNPCRDVFALGFRTQSGLTWRFRIVDENFKLLREYDWVQPMPNYNLIQFKTEGFPKDTVRVYYQAEKAGCIWRGHGDVLVEG